jgi:hypothetical protein
MAGFLDRARGAGPDDTLIFIHTGGTPGIFAYGDTLTAAAGEVTGFGRRFVPAAQLQDR